MYTITKGELWTIRQALEDKEPEQVGDALGIVNSILDKNVTIEITEDQMIKEPTEEELTQEDVTVANLEEELEEDHRVC